MALGTAGSLVISLGLNAAEFVSGLTKSEYQARQFAKSMERVATQIGTTLGVGITAASAGLILMTRNAINAADHLNDLSKSTGIAVATLGGLGFAAEQSGSSLEGVGKSVGKLNLQIAAAAAGNEQAQEAFKALGISMSELKNSSPDEVLAKIADRFASYEDGPNKAALGNRLFGKSYQDIIPLLDEGGDKLQKNIDYFKKYGGVTTEVAQQADEFNDTLKKIELLSGSFGRTLASELLPSLQAIGTEFLTAKEKGDQFKALASDLADFLKALTVSALYGATAFSQFGTVIGGYTAKLDALAHGDFKRFTFIGDELTADLDASSARLDKFVAAIKNTKKISDDFVGPPAPAAKRRQAPGLPGGNASGALDDPTKKILDGQIKALEDSIARERDLLQSREQLISISFQQGYLSIKDSFDRTQEARDEALKNTQDDYEKEIALQQAFANKSTTTAVQRAEAINKIAEIRAKEAKASAEAATQSQLQAIQRTIADEQYAAQLDELKAKVQDLAGETAKAAAIRFGTSQNTPFYRSLTPEGKANADLIGQQEIAQKALNDETRKYQLILGDIDIAQGYINLAQSTGAISEIEALTKTSALNKSYLADLQTRIDKYAEMAAANLATPEQLHQLDTMRLKFAELSSQTDLLADKFNKTFGDAFASALSDVATGAKSFKDAFNDMAKSITKSIADMASQDIASKLFGKGGGLTGIGDFLSKIFGGGGASATNTGADAIDVASKTNDAAKAATDTLSAATELGTSAVGMTTASTGLITAGTGLVTAATALTTAASALTASAGGSAAGGVGGLSSLFGGSGGGSGFDYFAADGAYLSAAGGTDSSLGGRYLVGERGPEMVNLPRGAQVISNDDLMRRRNDRQINITQHINVMPGANTQSARQAAAMARDAVSRSAKDR